MTKKFKNIKQKISSIKKIISKSSTEGHPETIAIQNVLILISAILWADGDISPENLKFAILALQSEFDIEESKYVDSILKDKYEKPEIIEAATELSKLNFEEKEQLLRSFIGIACSNNEYSKKEQEVINHIRKAFCISSNHAYELWKQAVQKNKKSQNIFGASAGLLIVAIVIVVFIIAASFLISVILGMILAYFFQPLQRLYKNKVLQSKVFIFSGGITSKIFSPITYPIKKLKFLLPKTKSLNEKIILPESQKREIKLINRSCRLTVFTIMFLLVIIIFLISLISSAYFIKVRNSIGNWTTTTTKNYEIHEQIERNKTSPDSTYKDAEIIKDQKDIKPKPQDFISAVIYKIESYKPKIESSPIFLFIKNYINKFINNPDNLKRLGLFILQQSGGLFTYTAGLMTSIFLFLMNVVLTFFFFAYFLHHMAHFNNKIEHNASAGKHIVNGLVNSGWMPDTTTYSRLAAIQILDNIMYKLRAWIRGYLTIIIIESIFYISTFLLIGVPYAGIVGLVAGFTVLLPYIGPVLSLALTCLVCLLLGSGGMLQIVIVIILYLFMNGIVEQLFIYPAIVGTALGLNECETIVIVLLGGILAGIPGLIFAVPVVSILKYLIPEIYHMYHEKRKKYLSSKIPLE